ncbi:MAG: acyltransferase family protein [Lachnospiraceae bacterium]|nr:acyltransferase family protein [Lachnospiraceae bacterium]
MSDITTTKTKRIDEISMMKGLGMLMVIFVHMSSVAGVLTELEYISRLRSFLAIPLMMMFIYLSGYTSSTRAKNPFTKFTYRAGRILGPYYLYTFVMILIYAVIYLGIEKRSLAWFGDGVLEMLFQLQSVHLFDPASTGVHPMFYGVLVGWFLFQMIVSEIVFTPILYALKGKKSVWKLVIAIALLAAGAILYMLNLQGLNGKFFPPVCKIFILPNIPGLAALMLIGSFAADCSALDLDSYSILKKVIALIVGIAIEVIFFLTDDYLYDFPIGKWGPFGPFSYFLAPISGIGFILIIGIICHLIKRFSPVKSLLIFVGDNSMDYLMIHFFVGVITAYIGGFWYEYLYDPIPMDDLSLNYLHFVILLAVVYTVSTLVILFKKLLGKKSK